MNNIYESLPQHSEFLKSSKTKISINKKGLKNSPFQRETWLKGFSGSDYFYFAWKTHETMEVLNKT